MSNTDFPYDSRPDYALWKRDVQGVAPGDLDPFARPKFTIGRDVRVASAGSCFARHIAANLQGHGFNYLCTEPGSEYSANFGNIYTTLQLLQLFERAYGRFVPVDGVWSRGTAYVDAFRPRAFEQGFATVNDLSDERERHLGAVRDLFEQLDVFVFTLGLTEGFFSSVDGAAYPACPGKDFGEFDPAKYAFRNLSVSENLDAMHRFIAGLRAINSNAKILLTLSPVPLVATMEDRSESVRRIFALELIARSQFQCKDSSNALARSARRNDGRPERER
jgi:hypothetical protein